MAINIRKINKVGNTTGNVYLTNADTVNIDGVQVNVDDGMDISVYSNENQEKFKLKQTIGLDENNQVNIEEARIDGSIVLEEAYNTAKKYVTVTHAYDNDNNKTTLIPQYLTGWQYEYNDTMYNMEEGTLSAANSTTFLSRFDANNNLDVYATWGNTRVIRVILFCNERPIPNYNPSATVTIVAPSSSYGQSTPFRLTDNYKKIIHKPKNVSDNFTGAFSYNNATEFGVGTGCPDNGEVTYFGVKDNTASINFTITSLGTVVNGEVKPWYTVQQNISTAPYYEKKLVTTYNYNESQGLTLNNPGAGTTWTCNANFLINNDITFLIPCKVNKFIVYAKPEDGDTTTPSSKGRVRITTILNSNPSFTSLQTSAQFLQQEENVTFEALPNEGYSFSGWYKNNVSVSSNSTMMLTLNSSNANDVYEARFSQGQYYITYHKQIPQY